MKKSTHAPFINSYLLIVIIFLSTGCQNSKSQQSSTTQASMTVEIQQSEEQYVKPLTSTLKTATSHQDATAEYQLKNDTNTVRKSSTPSKPAEITPIETQTKPFMVPATKIRQPLEEKYELPISDPTTKEYMPKDTKQISTEAVSTPSTESKPQVPNTKRHQSSEKHDDASETTQVSNIPHEPPSLPKIMPDIRAPDRYKHPLQHANKIIFMLGEDDNGHYLYGEGPLLTGAHEKMLRYINFYKESGIELKRLMLHSPGGLVKEGLLIGNYIRQNNWTTDSDKHMRCYSSCGFIFASGVKKRIQKGAEIGFHRPYIPTKEDTPEFIKQVYDEYQPYWSYIQGDHALYDIFMKQYGRDDMYILRSGTISKYMQVEVY
ncbi:hypothetical protein GCM10011607_02560 [Shewanella inventionis]|uniref:Alpha/beta hydrolase n=2 Tax=Shewanella inventionis TaxID=1738770 RepID=A0ABQ1INI6_9GAMM|nr:hypothetical protein GCM10011607_02560 [Shewanella inventionis]